MTKQFNRKNKNGSWTLCGEYLAYRREGGLLNPASWNQIIKERIRLWNNKKFKKIEREMVSKCKIKT